MRRREVAPEGRLYVPDHATEQILIKASPKRCYEVAANIEAYPEWIGDMKAVIVLERDDKGRPLVTEFRAAAFGKSTSYTLRYDYSSAPTRLSWSLTTSDLLDHLEGTYDFELASGGACTVTYHLEAALKVPIPSFVKSRAEHRIRATALRELKARVESTS